MSSFFMLNKSNFSSLNTSNRFQRPCLPGILFALLMKVALPGVLSTYISSFPQFQCHRCIADVEHFNCSACSSLFRPLNGVCSFDNFVYFMLRLFSLPIPNGRCECPMMLREQSFPCRVR